MIFLKNSQIFACRAWYLLAIYIVLDWVLQEADLDSDAYAEILLGGSSGPITLGSEGCGTEWKKEKESEL